MTDRDAESAAAPVFILSWGGRTGSTWVARLLTSTGGILIWGEQGLLAPLHVARGADWTRDEPRAGDLREFRALRNEANLARLLPFASDLDDAWARFADDLLGGAAKREGYPRWGKKEIDWDLSDVAWIRRSWPRAKIVFLYRDFLSVYKSAVGTGWYTDDEGLILRRWLRYGRQAIERLTTCPSPFERLAAYGQLLRDPAWLARWCDLPPCAPDLPNTWSTSASLTAEQQNFHAAHLAEIEELQTAAERLAGG